MADDSQTIQRVVNLTFADEGFDVVAVGDGDAAIREIAASRPDIVLADVHMPGPSGYEICSLLRGIDETAGTPVILLVGSFEKFDPEEAERAGADAFVTKPFQSIRQLVDQVKDLLSRNVTEERAPAAVLPEEAEKPPPEKDTRDIDSLYQQSFGETVRMPEIEGDPASGAFEADKLDDEIIETVYVSGQEEDHIDSAVPTSEFDGEIVEPVDEGTLEPAAASSETEEVDSFAYEETLQMDAPPRFVHSDQAATAEHSAPTEELRRDPFATTTDAFDLDDVDLLDLTLSNAKEEEYTFTTPSDAVAQGSNKQVVTLSPELLDVIVQKVVEKLSEKY